MDLIQIFMYVEYKEVNIHEIIFLSKSLWKREINTENFSIFLVFFFLNITLWWGRAKDLFNF